MTKSCNGWTNYETWITALWIENDGSIYHQVRSTAADLRDANDADSDDEAWLLQLAESLKSQIEESIPELQGVYSDLLNAAIADVNWLEIARSLTDE